jgi:cytochrome c oxidase subunit 1
VVAHFHFAMVPVMLAFLGGLHHWWPKITGRMFNDNWGRVGCLVISVGVVATFFTQFILGSRGMPRRCFNYPAQFQTLQQISTIGAYVMSAGLAIAAATLARSLLEGPPAPANPWGGATLEWRCGSPPPHDNFATTPQAGDPYDFSGLEFDPAIGGYGFRSGFKPPFSPG